jgi:hypothetical protein
MPPYGDAITPTDCVMTSHAVSHDGTHLTFTLRHPPSTLLFHINASVGAGTDGALNLSLLVELPPAAKTNTTTNIGITNTNTKTSTSTGTSPGTSKSNATPNRPTTIMTAFPYITGIAISNTGATNAGINHFETGLGTDGQ